MRELSQRCMRDTKGMMREGGDSERSYPRKKCDRCKSCQRVTPAGVNRTVQGR